MNHRSAVVDPPAEFIDAAEAAARSAERAAGVRVRAITEMNDVVAATSLLDEIWAPDPANRPMTPDILRALIKAGNYACAAYEGEHMLGVCLGFFGAPEEKAMHSHVAGVSTAGRGRSIGFTLKVHQRAWAMSRGLHTISWTFDPLVCRNAYFDLAKLAAVPVEYHTNFYGVMNDGINGVGETDRLLVTWSLASAQVAAASKGYPMLVDADTARANGARAVLSVGGDGEPALDQDTEARTVLVGVPVDIEALRDNDPSQATRWRIALRNALSPLMRGGYQVAGFDRSGWYVLTKEES